MTNTQILVNTLGPQAHAQGDTTPIIVKHWRQPPHRHARLTPEGEAAASIHVHPRHAPSPQSMFIVSLSMYSLSTCELAGDRSFCSARVSICRMRSRVTDIERPISASVRGLPSRRP